MNEFALFKLNVDNAQPFDPISVHQWFTIFPAPATQCSEERPSSFPEFMSFR